MPDALSDELIKSIESAAFVEEQKKLKKIEFCA